MDSITDFTSKMLTLEVLLKIYLGSLAYCLNGLSSPRNAQVCHFFVDKNGFQYSVLKFFLLSSLNRPVL